MCQLNHNKQKQASEEQDISFKAQIPCSTYEETSPNSPYIVPDPTTKALAVCTPSQPTSDTFHPQGATMSGVPGDPN